MAETVTPKEPKDLTSEERRAILDTPTVLPSEDSGHSEEVTPGVTPPEPGTDGQPPAAIATLDPSTEGQPVEQPPADPIQQKLAEFETKMKPIVDLASKVPQLLARMEDLQKYNGHLTNTVGTLRGKQPEKPVVKPSDNEILEQPAAGVETMVRAVQEEDRRRQSAEMEKTQAEVNYSWNMVKEYIPDIETLIPGMVEVLKDRGLPADVLQIFQKHPAAIIRSPEHLVELATVAQERRSKSDLQKTIDELKKQVEMLKKGPDKIAKNLRDAAAAQPTISSRNVKSEETPSSFPTDFRDMSPEAFAALKKKIGLA